MTLVRGWKARRDAAAKIAQRDKDRSEIRRIRAQITENLQPVVDAPEVAEPVAVVEAPAPAAEPVSEIPAKKGRKTKDPVILDGEYLVEED